MRSSQTSRVDWPDFLPKAKIYISIDRMRRANQAGIAHRFIRGQAEEYQRRGREFMERVNADFRPDFVTRGQLKRLVEQSRPLREEMERRPPPTPPQLYMQTPSRGKCAFPRAD